MNAVLFTMRLPFEFSYVVMWLAVPAQILYELYHWLRFGFWAAIDIRYFYVPNFEHLLSGLNWLGVKTVITGSINWLLDIWITFPIVLICSILVAIANSIFPTIVDAKDKKQ